MDTEAGNCVPTSLTERLVFETLQAMPMLLAPVRLERVELPYSNQTNAGGFIIRATGYWDNQSFTFNGIVRARSTPQQLQLALDMVEIASIGPNPLIVVPYLSEAALHRLEECNVSGVDLCGNGVIIIPGRLLVRRGGAPNRYPENAPIRNPFAGRAAAVCRKLAMQVRWPSLADLHEDLGRDAVPLSLGMCSKVVSALAAANLIVKEQRQIRVRDRIGMLDGLAAGWSKVRPRRVQAVHFEGAPRPVLASMLSHQRWAFSGVTSALRYVQSAQDEVPRVIVENIDHAMAACRARFEPIPSFASAIFMAYDDLVPLCGTEAASDGTRWSGPLQTWLELQAGDARQRDMANDLRKTLL